MSVGDSVARFCHFRNRGVFPTGIIAAFFVAVTSASQPLIAQQSLSLPALHLDESRSSDSTASLVIDEIQAQASIEWLSELAMKRMPRSFEGDKNWGDTKKVWSGVKVETDGLKVKTHRRFRKLEHGRWIRYEVTLPEPTATDAVTVNIDEVTSEVDSTGSDRRWKIRSSISSPMKFTARVQRWNFGVRLYSMTIHGQMRLRMVSTASVGLVADYSKTLPDLVIDPQIEQAHLVLERFEVDRVSHIGGDAAEQWGEIIEDVLVERLVKKQNDRLVAKLNKEIRSERDSLSISLSGWLSKLAVTPSPP